MLCHFFVQGYWSVEAGHVVSFTLSLLSYVLVLLPAAAFEAESLFPFSNASPIMLLVSLPYHFLPFDHPSRNSIGRKRT